MWVIKSKSDTVRERLKRAVRCFFQIGGIVFLFAFAFVKTGIEKRGPSHPLSWEQCMTLVPQIVLVSAIIGACAAAAVAFTVDSCGVFICIHCGKPRYSKRAAACPCGGKYVQIEKLK